MTNNHQYIIQFSKNELSQLNSIIHKGNHNARVVSRARILLLSRTGKSKDTIATELDIGRSTVQRTRDHYQEGGLSRALYDAPRPGQPRKLDDKAESHLVALACSDPPSGADHWTLELLAERMIKDKKVETISTVAIWHRLNAHDLKPWREKNVVHTQPHP